MSGQIIQREVKTFDAASLTGSAQNFGSVTAIATYKWSMINASNRDVEIDDGTGEDSIYLPAGATLNIGEGLTQEGKAINIQGEIKNGTQLQITGVTGVAGTGTIVAYLFGD